MAIALAPGEASASASRTAPNAAEVPAESPPSNDDERKVAALLDIDSDDADDHAEALTKALRARIHATPHWSLLESPQSLSTLVIALRCPPKPDAACLTRIANQLHVDRFFWGTTKHASAHHLRTEVHLWARGESETMVEATYRETLDDAASERLRVEVDRMVTRLIGAAPAESTVAATDVATPAITQTNDTQKALGDWESHMHKERGSSARRIGAYVALGIGAALTAGGVIQAVRFVSLRDEADTRRTRVPSHIANVCAANGAPGAAEACVKVNEARRARTFEIVGFGAGAAALATGVILLLTEKHSSAPHDDRTATKRVTVTPYAWPSGGGANFVMSF